MWVSLSRFGVEFEVERCVSQTVCVPDIERLSSQLLTGISCYDNSTETNSSNSQRLKRLIVLQCPSWTSRNKTARYSLTEVGYT